MRYAHGVWSFEQAATNPLSTKVRFYFMSENPVDIDPSDGGHMVYYHPINSSYRLVYRLVRLRALSDAPAEFSSTFAREIAFTSDKWKTRLENIN